MSVNMRYHGYPVILLPLHGCSNVGIILAKTASRSNLGVFFLLLRSWTLAGAIITDSSAMPWQFWMMSGYFNDVKVDQLAKLTPLP